MPCGPDRGDRPVLSLVGAAGTEGSLAGAAPLGILRRNGVGREEHVHVSLGQTLPGEVSEGRANAEHERNDETGMVEVGAHRVYTNVVADPGGAPRLGQVIPVLPAA